MAQQVLDVGSNANDGTGDNLRAAMVKVNENFTELYASPLIASGINIKGNEIIANRSNDDLKFVPAGTGGISFPAIRINDNNIEGLRSNEDINLIPSGTGSVTFGAIKFQGNNITGSRSNENINLIPSGTGSVAISGALSASSLNIAGDGATVTGIIDEDNMSSDSAVKLATQQSIKKYVDDKATAEDLDFQGDSGGALSIDLDSETLTIAGGSNITTTGSGNTITIALDSTLSGFATVGVGSLTLSGQDITSSSNADITITPGGTGNVVFPALTFNDNNITGTRSNEDINITPAGTGGVVFGAIKISGNNIEGTRSNEDIVLSPSGTGTVVISNLTVDSNINIQDNIIKTTVSNSNLELAGSSSGKVVLTSDADIDGGNIDGTVIGGTTAVAGSFTTVTANTSAVIDGVTITDNEISSNSSNANLYLTGNGTGSVRISGFVFPTTDGSSGQFIKTDGAGTLSFATAGATLNYSDIADATTTIASSSQSVLNTFSASSYRSAKYFISWSDAENTKYEVVEANVTHDGTNAFISTFGSTTNAEPDGSSTTTMMPTWAADIDSGNVRVLVTNPTADSMVFKFQRIAIDA